MRTQAAVAMLPLLPVVAICAQDDCFTLFQHVGKIASCWTVTSSNKLCRWNVYAPDGTRIQHFRVQNLVHGCIDTKSMQLS